jgi:zinc and cadmium transporter
MSSNSVYALVSVSLVSLLALAGLLAIPVKPAQMRRIIFVLVALGTGTMLGNAIVHLIPESFEFVDKGAIAGTTVSILILAGMTFCFIMEKVLKLHCHHGAEHVHEDKECHAHDDDDDEEHHTHVHGIHPTGHMSMISHMVDNLTDGMLIGSMYLISIPAGLATTLAILMHELPMEFGSFGVLVKAGFSKRGAVLVNLSSAIVALIGTILVLALGASVQGLPVYLTPICGGMVLYITMTALIPRMLKETNPLRSLLQIGIASIGVIIMIVLKIYE